ncbi:camp-dependent protein kinase 8 [Mycotypha africana]|uniref:camp-dependent protein kinase 8 n=1 Tax=Mycotypha africana TaxID=64632 RepID=UPI002300901E|nr:camp-dependent protein kinase 8 [Mycotypha africana]KAI8968847.1 camp-dependent protein kinase 8 [Mycotypha africana]
MDLKWINNSSYQDKDKKSREEEQDKAKETLIRFQQLTCDSLPHSPPHTPLGSFLTKEASPTTPASFSSSLSSMPSEPSTHVDLSNTPSLLPIPDDASKDKEARSFKKRRSLAELSLSCFTLIRTLGTGSFGRVHLARSNANHSGYCAIKVLRKIDIVRTKQVEHTRNERSILARLHSPYVVQLYGTFQDDARLYMVLEYVQGGELFSYMRQRGQLKEEEAAFYAAEVTWAIDYLHSQDIVYRDLKPENILLDAQGHVKLTDFGFAKLVPDITWTLCGTPDYLAPEIIQSKGYGKAVDYWALGVLIYEMLAGVAPFYDENQFKLYEKIVACEPNYPSTFRPTVIDLLNHLLTPDLSNRYGNLKEGPLDVIRHPWFQQCSIDVGKLKRRQVTAPFVPTVQDEGDASHFDTYEEERMPYGQPEPDPYRKYFTDF